MPSKQLSPSPKLQFIDENGNPYASGFLFTYLVGTDTPQVTYADAAGAANTNPVVLDLAGRATVYLGTNGYKFKLYDANMNLIFTQDQIFANYISADSVQTISNKTLDDTNVITVKDGDFTMESSGDTTKKMQFALGGITAGNTRTITIPDQDLTLAGQNFQNVFTKRQEWGQGANVASANDMTLGLDGNSFYISGSTQINAITTANWTKGSIVVLKFIGSPVVKNATAGGAGTASIYLQGGMDWTPNAGDTLVLEFMNDGAAKWNEIGRAYAADGAVLTATVTIADTDIKLLPTVAIQIIPAPGADRVIEIIGATFVLDAAAGAYTNVDAGAVMGLITSSVVGITDRVTDGFFTAASKKAVQVTGGSIDTDGAAYSSYANRAIQVSVNNAAAGNFTGGNAANTLKVRVTYQVRSFA